MTRGITIAGGGLAGLSLAIALRRHGVPATVLEAGGYPRHRVCGEFISGVTNETLRFLGIDECLADAKHHLSLAWHGRGRRVLTDTLPTPALGISRHSLDLRLRDLFLGLGGTLMTSTRARANPAEGLVWTAGRRPVPGRWIGLKAHVRLPTSTDLEMHCGANGYAGLAAVEDGWTNVCGLFLLDRRIAASGPGLLPAYLEAGGNGELAKQLRTASWREGSFTAIAGFELGAQPETRGLLCLGDAARMIPPFTGNGMSMAFQSAESALDPLLAWSRGGLSWQEAAAIIKKALDRRFRRRMTISVALHRALLRPGSRAVFESLATFGILPFRPLLSLLR